MLSSRRVHTGCMSAGYLRFIFFLLRAKRCSREACWERLLWRWGTFCRRFSHIWGRWVWGILRSMSLLWGVLLIWGNWRLFLWLFPGSSWRLRWSSTSFPRIAWRRPRFVFWSFRFRVGSWFRGDGVARFPSWTCSWWAILPGWGRGLWWSPRFRRWLPISSWFKYIINLDLFIWVGLYNFNGKEGQGDVSCGEF